MKRWLLLGWVGVICLSGLCFLVPMSPSVKLQGRDWVLVSPRGPGRGVIARKLVHGLTTVHLIDADLRTPGVRVRVHARNASRREWGWSVADARSVADWCRATGAVGGINGGFFGEEVAPGRKEVIGLLKVDGTTYARAPLYRSRSDRRITYAHSTFGIADDRVPMVAWVTSDPRSAGRLRAFPTPENLRDGRPWRPDHGLSGGPRLIHRGRLFVAARDERLASAGAQPRTFLGYSLGKNGKPDRLVLVTATAMTYSEAASFLMEYFQERHGVPCAEAMCLDGGPSTQIAYRSGNQLVAPHGGGVTVPTAVLIHDDTRRPTRVAKRAEKTLP